MPRAPVDDRSRPARVIQPALSLRRVIDEALAEGAAPQDLVLELTHADASSLKRDRTLAVEDISFAGGTMRFLGIKVHVGGVTISRLDRAGTPGGA